MKLHHFCIMFLVVVSQLFSEITDHLKICLNKSYDHKLHNIDFIYLINLDKRPEKFERCSKQLNRYGIFPYRFSAINGWELPIEVINDVGVKYETWMDSDVKGTYYYVDEDQSIQQVNEFTHVPGRTYFAQGLARGGIACVLSHLSILQDAIDSGYETIWVLEDDIEVLKDPTVIPDLIDQLDNLVGKEGWDILFTDRDMRDRNGTYNKCYSYVKRPNFQPQLPLQFFCEEEIGSLFRPIIVRWGTHSMIVRKSGIQKIVNYLKTYGIFLQCDMEVVLPPNIKMFSVLNDIVGNQIDAFSDNGSPTYAQ